LLCILAFYVPDFGTTGKLIYAFVTYLCLSFLYTLVNIPFCAMLPFLTNDSRERTTLSAVRILLGSLGATIVAVATLPLVGALGKGISSTASSIRRWFSALLPPSSCW
jgi:Na+/melibiose symporter-like transporter